MNPDRKVFRQELFHRLGVRFRTVGWWAIGVLVVTGTLLLRERDLLHWSVLGAPWPPCAP